MTDEVAADDSEVPRRDELLMAELLRYVVELYHAECVTDGMLEEHPRNAVYRSQVDAMNFLNRAGPLVQDLGFAPKNSHLPGDAVARLLMAFDDLNRGVIDTVLGPPEELETRRGRHMLPLHEQHGRVRPAVLMELLIMDGYGVEKAAKEVADRTGDSMGAIKRRWRAIKNGVADSWASEQFNTDVAETKRLVEERGGTAADYIKLAAGVLGPTAKKHRKRPQSGPPD
jgi:hypothetical protein